MLKNIKVFWFFSSEKNFFLERKKQRTFIPSLFAGVVLLHGAAAPALYTDAQANAGMAKFIGNCGVCHGAKLQGMAGPALKGPNFASEKSNFSVSDVFTIVSQNMPATNPGSLEHDDYVQIMAYLLQQNGYPAGDTALTFDSASQSKVPLRYHGK